jgi:hypothetical protein
MSTHFTLQLPGRSLCQHPNRRCHTASGPNVPSSNHTSGGRRSPPAKRSTGDQPEEPTAHAPPGMKTRSSHQPVSPYTNTCNTKAMLTLAPSPPAPWTSNPTFNNTRSLLRHPLGPNSRALSLCSFLLQTRSTPWMGCILTFQRHQ